MCDPAFIVASAVGSAGQVANVAKQSRDLKAQERYGQLLFERNKRIADRDAAATSAALKRRFQQERAAAIQQIEENARAALAARSRARVAAGESGGLGQSFDSLLGSFSFREAEVAAAIERNLRGRTEQIEAELARVPLEQQSNILRSLPRPTPRPDFLGAALRIGGTLSTNFAQFKQRELLRNA